MGEREFAIAFMEQDTPAPPGTPNACLSKYERAIIATYNDITTAEMNGDTHINELLKREAGKPRPERLPQNPLVITGVNAGDVIRAPDSGSAPKAQAAPQGFKDNTTIARLAALEGGAVQNASAAEGPQSVGDLEPPEFDAPEIDMVGGPGVHSELDKKAHEFLQFLAKLTRAEKGAGSELQKPEFGGDIVMNVDSKSGRVSYSYDGHQKSKGKLNEVKMLAHRDNVVAMVHTHPPVEKGVWKQVDHDNRRPSSEDKYEMERLEKRVRLYAEQNKTGRTTFDIYAYIATPDGQIRRFDPENNWDGDGVVLWNSGTIWYYEDFKSYDEEALRKFE